MPFDINESWPFEWMSPTFAIGGIRLDRYGLIDSRIRGGEENPQFPID